MNEHAACLSRYVIASEPLQLPRRHFQGRVLFSTRSGALRTVTESVWDQLVQDRIDALPGKVRDALVNAGMLVRADQDEVDEVIKENHRAIGQHEVLYQVVQPSAWCQLDCSYCGQEHHRASMTAQVQAAFLERIAQRLSTGSYRQLHIGWFGAEPLAGIAVIRRLTPPLRALADAHGCGYSARIVTNGLGLSATMATELKEQLGVEEAEVTLDGPAAVHDLSRPTKQGQGSFTHIFSNIAAVVRNTALRVVVRCNVSQRNADQVVPLLHALADSGLASRLRFYTSPVYAWGNDAHQTALTPERYAEAELEWLALQYRLGFKTGFLPQRRPIVCIAVQRDAEVLDAHGHSYNCTEVPYVPAYAPRDGASDTYAIRIVRRRLPDTLEDGGEPVLAQEQEAPPAASPEAGPEAIRMARFNDRIASGAQAPCRACAMLPVCGGQCPKAWFEGHEPCPSAKLNIARRLALLVAVGEIEGGTQ